MTAVRMFMAVLAALVLQTLLSRSSLTGRAGLDLVLVTVAYLGLRHGPVVGLFAGTLGGLAQDALSTGIIGIGGLSKTIVGYVCGVVGSQFIVARPVPRFVLFVLASLMQVAVVVALESLLELRLMTRNYAVTLMQAAGNGLVGIVLFQVTDLLPGAAERRRMSRDRVRTSHLQE